MNDVICRLCLRQDNLTPIFVNLDQSLKYSKVLKLTTGLKIKLNDGLPQYICTFCTDLVNKSLDLRNQSQLSEKKLIEVGYRKINNIIDFSDNEISDSKSECEVESDIKEIPSSNPVTDLNLECIINSNSKEKDLSLNLETESNLKAKQPVLKRNAGKLKKESEIKNDCQLPVSEKDGGLELKREKALAVDKQPQMSKKEKRAMYMELVEGVFDPKGPVKCKVCKKTVSKWTCFVSHAKLHLGFKFMCEYCGKDFISTTQLKRHCRSFHGMARELSCKYCSYLALDAPQLLLHERREHTGDRPFVCDLCGARYHSRRCLLQHLESHRSTRDVQCPECPTRVKSRRHLARHRYSAHAHCRSKRAS